MFTMKTFITLTFVSILLFGCNSNDEPEKPEERGPKPTTPRSEYTKDAPGEWASVKNEHIPIVKFHYGEKKENIQITVPGKFSESHYIERIGIMDINKIDIDSKPLVWHDKPDVLLTVYPIPEDKTLKIYVKCNLHDLWTVPFANTPEDVKEKVKSSSL